MLAPSKYYRTGYIGALILSLGATFASAQGDAPLVPYPLDEVVRSQDMAARGLKESDFPRLKKLAENVYVFEALHQNIKTLLNNSLIVITKEGVLVVDGHGLVPTVQQLVAAIGKLTPQPIKYVVVGSDHGDHTGGNSAFPESAIFIGHPTSKANLETQASNPKRDPKAPRVMIPTELVSDKRTIKMGGTQIDILHLGRGHTGGDLMVYLPREKILWMSEMYHAGVFPSVGGGFPSEWVAAIQKAEKMDVRIFAPAHGFVDRPDILKEELANFRKALEVLIAEGKRLKAAGVSPEEAAKQVNVGRFASMYRYAENILPGLRRVYLELDGKLPTPPPAKPTQ